MKINVLVLSFLLPLSGCMGVMDDDSVIAGIVIAIIAWVANFIYSLRKIEETDEAKKTISIFVTNIVVTSVIAGIAFLVTFVLLG